MSLMVKSLHIMNFKGGPNLMGQLPMRFGPGGPLLMGVHFSWFTGIACDYQIVTTYQILT